MVAELRARGATRVVLFGSLARGDEPRARTDVDLAVWGLDLGELYGAMDDLGRMTGAKVDLVMGETMGQRLAAAVARDGVEIGDGPG
jgi:predicted nucleotidyltransferase